MPAQAAETTTGWVRLAQAIRSGDDAGTTDLYVLLTAPLRVRLSRVVSPDELDDSLHEVVVIVLEAIHRDGLRDPERLAAFVHTIAHRRAVAHIRRRILRRRFVDDPEMMASSAGSPEDWAARRERVEQLTRVLRRLRARDREILERFYFREQNADQICREMCLTRTQFRLFKSRAIARCFDLAKTQASQPPPGPGKDYLARPLTMA